MDAGIPFPIESQAAGTQARPPQPHQKPKSRTKPKNQHVFDTV